MTAYDDARDDPDRRRFAWAALILRCGLGAVFVIGGAAKLGQLLDPARQAGMVNQYLSPLGYINSFFTEYLFNGPFGAVLTPPAFLTALSAFELVSGLFLIAGLLVRPLALVYGLLLWSFVIALPVNTVPGVAPDLPAISSPAALVQIRDIGLSGLMFALYNLGAGALALGSVRRGRPVRPDVNWDGLGLLARLSVAAPLLVGGAFHGMDHIATFGAPAWALLVAGLVVLAGGPLTRVGAAGAGALLVAYIAVKIDPQGGVIANLNGFKRELALVAGAAVLAWLGGGYRFAALRRHGAVAAR